jgi:hypothetical protein
VGPIPLPIPELTQLMKAKSSAESCLTKVPFKRAHKKSQRTENCFEEKLPIPSTPQQFKSDDQTKDVDQFQW